MTISSCTFSSNEAGYVCAHAQKFPSPPWEFLLTCPNQLSSFNSIRINLWFYQGLGYVRASHACKLPIAPMGKLLTCLPQLTLAQMCEHTSVNYRLYVPQRP